MSEAELLQSLIETKAVLAADVALYNSVLFAYFVVAHTAGKGLTATQITFANIVYLLVMSLGLLSVLGDFTLLMTITADLSAMGSVYVEGNIANEWWSPAVATVYAIALIMSLLYMRHCRKGST